MSLPLPPNVSANIYRTANPSSPYSLGSAGPQGVQCYLQAAVADGRFGSANWLRWTHVLFLPPGTDVRDAYNSQLDPSRNNNNGDTVIINGVTDSNKTAYYVVFVEVISRGASDAHLRAYLDRFAPSAWPTDSI
jgi:hypothetical protein